MTLRHAGIIPLIGGMALGVQKALGVPPEYLVSWSPFIANDSHLLNYHEGALPYYVVDEGGERGYKKHGKIDVVHSVCPCSGLSTLSHGFGDHNSKNDWMRTAAEYVMGEMKPRVYFGENAPHLMGNIGKNVRADLIEISRKHGYTPSFYRTRSLLHGTPQVRERSFYFFWKGNKAPVFNYYDEPHQPIQDLITSVKGNSQTEITNSSVPSRDPFYRYLLEEVHGGLSHREMIQKLVKTTSRGGEVINLIEISGTSLKDVSVWMKSQGYEKEAARSLAMYEKLQAGGSVMRRRTILPVGHIGAFVGHYPRKTTHPVEDRYLSYRECMSIMGLPENFELLNPKKNLNHVSQNVPLKTAYDMGVEVREALLGNREWVKTDSVLFQYNTTRKEVWHKPASRDLTEFIK